MMSLRATVSAASSGLIARAHLIAVACSPPPKGRKRWTLRLLAHKLVELEMVDAVSYETRFACLSLGLKVWDGKTWGGVQAARS